MSHRITPALLAQLDRVRHDFAKAFQVLRDTRTLSATNTFQAYLRVPDSDLVIALHAPSPWADDPTIRAVVANYDGEVVLDETADGSSPLSGRKAGGNGQRYAQVFQRRPEVNVVIHVHTPYLGGWASAHRVLPIRYAASQRVTLARELPIYIDRRQPEQAFIVERIEQNPYTPAILEANGGATFWGESLLQVSKLILLIEEGAHFQGLAELFGGSQEFGPGVLEQQWKMTGLWAQGQKLLERVA
ncbi:MULTISPECIES: class II aldolase/adducin family protein [Pseudomonas]|uniref:Ribulose phosphate epimerase n=1 Tax=Pseudomonas guariconensis TaxID=1288410 RepID=A0AAX0VUJ6_9PSED|nr:class II aldolase/adducin family protein [Pseudomonas guariconensis]MBH3360679.1 class II aldolase/adducin family protein [Pseudomonas guariconensis]MCO7623443.1 class II aldolase/adducin family protein [Pseudomonas guariconensis]MDM9593483.1 class II aldolase/adducin family protein [Pseudomonas guariconensis]MDM9606310.1 class II aldolase/adducin family protein [Pseudomonas guariconensis]MDM9611267.1 class II aldolase/adducin family protein [Pseudomonas guariconensis]